MQLNMRCHAKYGRSHKFPDAKEMSLLLFLVWHVFSFQIFPKYCGDTIPDPNFADCKIYLWGGVTGRGARVLVCGVGLEEDVCAGWVGRRMRDRRISMPTLNEYMNGLPGGGV
jgi:hypothetical protein